MRDQKLCAQDVLVLVASCPGNVLLDGDRTTTTLGPPKSQSPLSGHDQKT